MEVEWAGGDLHCFDSLIKQNMWVVSLVVFKVSVEFTITPEFTAAQDTPHTCNSPHVVRT